MEKKVGRPVGSGYRGPLDPMRFRLDAELVSALALWAKAEQRAMAYIAEDALRSYLAAGVRGPQRGGRGYRPPLASVMLSLSAPMAQQLRARARAEGRPMAYILEDALRLYATQRQSA